MKSWDCFDTLVARLYYGPHTVFAEAGRRLGIENFVQQRMYAEQISNKTYTDIYNHLPGADPEVEFQVELEHCFGITENILQVEDGDVIVSDMYLSESQIRKILEKCGLNKDVQIYVTPDGKHKGYVWSMLPQVSLHTGDNLQADVYSAQQAGIPTYHYTGALLNGVEQYVAQFDENLACWMRYVRLKCPGDDEHNFKKYWEDQSNYNLPVLALASLELPEDQEIVFNYRDCVYFKPLYEAITGKKSYSVTTSRKCYRNPSKPYINYVVNETKNRVLVDLQGTGSSVRDFFAKLNISQPTTIYVCGPVEEPTIGLSASCSDAIEKHNCSYTGTLVNWTDIPIHASFEHSSYIIEPQRQAMLHAVNSAKYFKIRPNRPLIHELLVAMSTDFTVQNMSWIDNH
ncbi:MAG: hypothetical protein N2235_18240 [Fischerella sp.]|nr:hypothetical protein [Fischerella sp.]